MHVAVNLSPSSLSDAALADAVARLLDETGTPPERLTLEITESTLMADTEYAVATLDALRRLGVGLSIDDFGTGYSSLSRLRDLPMQEVKIDRSFVQRLSVDERDQALVRSAIQMGHALNLTVVAEGVEDGATMDFLADAGCDLAQGYHIARPMPADAFATWLRERRNGAPLPPLRNGADSRT
jgi:EAL domain-containing protein (putative c-di-GMP-specific phosphodiesterase class I)